MALWNETEFASWGRTRRVPMRLARPERVSDLMAALSAGTTGGRLAIGGGLSYGDAPVNTAGHGIVMKRLDRIISFDRESGELVAEAGLTFRDLIETLLPHGFLPPAIPGTAGVTLGGAVANDIHGKNHDHLGSFGHHVQWLELILATGDRKRISPTQEPELFAATVGGIGLTGVIHLVCLRLLKVPSAFVDVTEQRCRDLDHLMATLAEQRDKATYSVAWVDALAGGRHLGRGILELAELSETVAIQRGKKADLRITGPRIPFDAPGMTLNRLGGTAFNAAYYYRVPEKGRTRQRPIPAFLFPLDRVVDWNRLYGRRGFFQFQCVIPDAQAGQGIPALFGTIKKYHLPVYLAVLKTMGKAGPGLLSFPQPGYTLTLDFANRGSARPALAALEAVVRDHGGRVYLAKDATLTTAGFHEMYPDAGKFKELITQCAPDNAIQSDMARRFALVEAK